MKNLLRIILITIIGSSQLVALPSTFKGNKTPKSLLKKKKPWVPFFKSASKNYSSFWIEPSMGFDNFGINVSLSGVLHINNGYEVVGRNEYNGDYQVFASRPLTNIQSYQILIGKGKLVGKRYRYFRMGIGFREGEAVEVLSKELDENYSPGFISFNSDPYDYEVEISHISEFGIPVELGGSIGKYIGIGYKVSAFLSKNSTFGLGVVFPVGGFNKNLF